MNGHPKANPYTYPSLQQELLAVIQKYVHVDKEAISVSFEQDGNQETLELNIVMPDDTTKRF